MSVAQSTFSPTTFRSVSTIPVGPLFVAAVGQLHVGHAFRGMGEERQDVALEHDAFEQAATERFPPSGGTMEREGERDDVGEAQAGGHVVQGGEIVADIVGAVLVVVIVDAEDDGAIPVARGIEIAEHVVPRAGVGAGDPGAAEGEPGSGGLLVGHARIVGEARVAQGDDEVAAVPRLGLLLAPQDEFE